MRKPDIDEVITDAAQWDRAESGAVQASLDILVNEARAAARVPAPRKLSRRVLFIPAIGLAAVALTAGTAVYITSVEKDVTIPISYVTDTGLAVSCTTWIAIGPDDNAHALEVRNYLNSQDWDGIGQQIYTQAVSTPSLTQSGDPAHSTFEATDQWIFLSAMSDLTLGKSAELRGGDRALEIVSDSDCTGILH